MNAKLVLRTLLKLAKKHSTKLLAGSAIVAEALSLWFMNKGAPIAKERLKSLDENATNWEKIKTAGPVYIPAIIMFAVSSGCIVGGCAIGEAKFAAMAGIASASEATLRKYEQKMIDTVGEEKVQEMHAEIAKDMAKEKPPKETDIVYTKHGGDLFFDKLSGRYFTSTEEFVRNAVSKLNNSIYGDMWSSVNEYYSYLDIPEVKLGGYVGWNSDNLLEVSFYGDLTPEGKPYSTIVYYNDPVLYNGKNPNRIE